MNVTLLTTFKEIVKSLIAAYLDKKLRDKLIFTTHPKNYSKHHLDFGERWDYLQSVCTVTEFSTEVYNGVGTALD